MCSEMREVAESAEALAADLVHQKVTVITATSTPAAKTAPATGFA